jgi:hypothetical protein
MGQGDLKEEVGSEMLRTVLCVGAEGGRWSWRGTQSIALHAARARRAWRLLRFFDAGF